MSTPAQTGTDDLHAFLTSAGLAPCARDILIIDGSDSGRYLQGQLSQDVESMVNAESRLSFILEPDGVVDALVRITRYEGGFIVDCDPGQGSAVLSRLERFKLRVDVRIEVFTKKGWAVRGPRASELALICPDALDCLWRSIDGFDVLPVLIGEAREMGMGVASGTRAGLSVHEAPVIGNDMVPAGLSMVRRCSAMSLEALRVLDGYPAAGAEIDGRAKPGETGMVPCAVSFSKGCYTGQELVERVESRGGKVPRRLCHVVVQGDYALQVGATILKAGGEGGQAKEVGWSTSVARIELDGTVTVHLGYVHRNVGDGDEVTIASKAGLAQGVVRELRGRRVGGAHPGADWAALAELSVGQKGVRPGEG